MSRLRNNVFFTSDLHWGHEKVIKYSNRPHSSLEDMHDRLIKGWNSTVRPNDLVYVLGDWAMYMCKDDLRELMAKLNGNKVLIRGNHDLSQSEMVGVGFTACMENAEIVIAGRRVLLSHYPYRRSWWHTTSYKILNKIMPRKYWKPREFVKQLKDNGLWLLHGHVHSKLRRYVPNKKMIHVGVDAWGYKPVPIQKIGEMISQIELGIYKE